VIKAVGISKTIGRKTILQNIDLHIRPGEFITVFGPNGAGKSSLLKILSLVNKPSRGQITIDGKNAAGNPAEIRKKIGVISHQTFLNENLTARENLTFYGKMYGVPDLKNRIYDVLDEVGLGFSLNEPVRTFSRGMQQRLAIARAILHNPAILYLDEPYTGLDPHAIQILNNVLADLHQNKRTVFLITHNFEEGVNLSNRILFVVKGKIVYDGKKNAMSKDELKKLYLSKVEGAA
jgi:heme exporter protein A